MGNVALTQKRAGSKTIMIKGVPCIVQSMSTAKTGKHGSAKCMITGIDPITGQKFECVLNQQDLEASIIKEEPKQEAAYDKVKAFNFD